KTTSKKPGSKKATTRTAGPAARAATTPPRARIQAPPPRPERRVRPAKFDPKQLAAIREQLAKERVELEQQLTEVEEESFTGTQSELTGDAGLNDDFADAGSATFDRENALSIRNNIRDLIDQITRAMGRIDEGTYGTCERCGKPIDAARLKALPHALLCMDCKRREERAR
ncbi:MAG TPA: TraR/DksA C4-type zinc finger protein, partial [Actinomycetota bacterium]|nr:TraR/DksA C4-type zinc finger protein [Actinomycetota bacterium]